MDLETFGRWMLTFGEVEEEASQSGLGKCINKYTHSHLTCTIWMDPYTVIYIYNLRVQICLSDTIQLPIFH